VWRECGGSVEGGRECGWECGGRSGWEEEREWGESECKEEEVLS